MATLGRNIVFPIYKDVDGERIHFENLSLRKSVVDSSLMSLADNISGTVFYKNNSLQVSMHEYIIYNDVKYVLLTPPTIVREGLATDNSETKGMTKYSFVFYHPMCQLNNLPFTDIAVTSDELRYKSQDKNFSWIGTLEDFINKLNKNLQGTEWVATISDKTPQNLIDTLSEVLAFESATIADAIKTMYDSWKTPFVIDSIKEGETYYSQGKRFQILVGLPSNEIYANDSDRQNLRPFVFRFGKGVGLKNNSATPRNNKIITRIAGKGSADNVPYGYPQIVWTGDSSWEYTINNDGTNPLSYPIYEGIVGGQLVKLIKHPFTRTELMPSIYAQCVNKKVNPYATGYNPNMELVDYYDADDSSIYQNVIVPNAPSYEFHQFEDIKPELGEQYIVSATPLNANLTPAEKWDDTMDGEGNYLQSYFKVKLPVLSFDLYACAAITQEMQINMRSGACIGCTFTVQVDWDAYKANFYNSQGDFLPNGAQRDLTIFPRSDQEQIEIILQKENNTFGIIMPNVYQNPHQGDQFVVLGISLPLSYITNAEERLDDSMKSYMLENNIHYFDYPLKFDEKFLYDNTNILSQIRNNTVIRFEFAGQQLELYVKQISIKYGEGVLPQYDITLTDDVSVVLNQIGQVREDLDKISTLISALRTNYSRNVWVELNKKLSRVSPDTANGKITFKQGLEAGEFTQDTAGAAIYKEGDSWHIEADFIHARRKLIAKELQIEEISHIGGTILLTAAEMVCDHVVEYDDYYRCYFLRKDEDGKTIYNKFKRHDQAIMMSFNVEEWEDGTNINRDRYYWRLVEAVSPANIEGDYHYIDLSKTDCDEATYTDAPKAGDKIVQLGYRDSDVENKDRQNAIIIAGAGSGSPYIDEYVGINSYTLEGKCKTRIKPNANFFTGRFDISGDSTFDGQSLMDMFNTDTIEEMMEMLEDLSGQVVDLEEGLIDIQDNIGEGLSTGNENLLRNTGFTGDYETMDVDGDLGVSEATQVYSDPLEHWERLNARVVANINSTSGFAVVLNNGLISQVTTKELVNGDWYNVSFRASGSILTVNIGDYSRTIPLNSSLTRYNFKFVSTGSSIFSITDASATVMEIQLSAGSVPNADWIPSPLDNTSAIAYYQNLVYLTNATVNASTTILGGLILSQMLRVGNYRDGHMSQETGGVSGIYASSASPFIWGGGTMEQAFYTIAKYAQDPSYQATNEEVAQMAKFVVTHGGRAILNDIVLRGYIYALGGYFRGEVYAENGIFNGTVNATSGEFKGVDGLFGMNLSADERALIVTGPNKVISTTQDPTDPSDFVPASDAEEVEYMRLGAWVAHTTRNLQKTIIPQLVGRILNSNGETASQFHLNAAELGFSNESTQTHYGMYEMGGTNLSTIILGNLPTDPSNCVTGQVWNQNGTLKIKE